ncbi:unnamed protein product, partial [Brassica oleracea var. botrytis]
MRSYLSCRFLFKHRNGFPTKLVRKLPHKTFHHEFLVLTPKPSRRNRAKQHLLEHEFHFFRNEEKTGSDVETNRSSSINTCKKNTEARRRATKAQIRHLRRYTERQGENSFIQNPT